MLLAGDIDATKTRLGIFSESGLFPPSPQNAMTFENARYPNLETIVADSIGMHPVTVSRACYGVGGPVVGSPVTLPNLPWLIDEKNLAELLNLSSVLIINDLLAAATVLPLRSPEDLYDLNKVVPSPPHIIPFLTRTTFLEAFATRDACRIWWRAYRRCASFLMSTPRSWARPTMLFRKV